ncbi:MAG: hypothetical protein NC821_05730, partial [Candidatus Omnitrophica bacterium]|nr:hypothetical protein [Candidatus Omnitrophota bacterium]
MARCLRFRGIAVFIAVLTIFALFGCGGGGGGGAQPAPAPTHIYGISARGGVGNAVSGGNGGEMEISNADPEGITILETGSVDTSF